MEFEETWNGPLKQTVQNVFGSSVSREDWTDAFAKIYSLCVARPEPYHERLYAALREFLSNHVQAIGASLRQKAEQVNKCGEANEQLFENSVLFLVEYANKWQRFSEASTHLDKLFLYLNNHFVGCSRQELIDVANVAFDGYGDGDQPLVPVGKLCVLVWHDELLSDERIHSALKLTLSVAIGRDRKVETNRIAGQCVSHTLLDMECGTRTLDKLALEAISITVRSLIETDLTVETVDDPAYETPSSNNSSRRLVTACSTDAVLKTYRAVCETPYFEETSVFYSSFAQKLMTSQTVTAAAYARVMLQLLEAEEKRANAVLDKASVETALERARAVALTDQLDFLFRDVRTAIETGRVEELHTLFELLRPIRASTAGIDRLVNSFQTHVERVGYADLCNLRSGEETHSDSRKLATRNSSAEFVCRFVERLLELFSRLTEIFVRETFSSDQSFVAALDKAFSNLVNLRWSKLQQAAAESATASAAMNVDESASLSGKAPAGFPPHCSSAELLARYCDMLLRGSPPVSGQQRSEINVGETDARLGQCVTLFRYVDDKDLFHRHYTKFLSRRLVTAPSAAGGGVNMELEESMVNRLKQLCGFQYTHRFTCMFKDVQLAKELVRNFDEFVENLKRGVPPVSRPNSNAGTETQSQEELDRLFAEDKRRACDLSVNTSWHVLQANSWPITSVNIPPVLLPMPVQNAIQLFESFYRKTQSGRKLTWLPQYSTGELRANFAKRSYLVTMSAFHATILWQFNSSESYTVGELRQLTALNQNDLTACLRTLVDQRLLVVHASASTPSVSFTSSAIDNADNEGEMEVDMPTSSSNAGSFSEDTRIEVNASYANKRSKYRLPLYVHKEASQETSEAVRQRVDEDRKLCLQAAIVRVMKAKKVMLHTNLMNEILSVGKTLHFTPSVALIKRCVEILIEKQYLQRSPNSQEEYQYLA